MRKLFLALALVTGVFAITIAEANHLEAIPTYVVGVEELDFYPSYSLTNGRYVGAARDILDAFAQDNNIRLTYLPLPIKRLYAELASGRIDFKFPDSPNWDSSAPRPEAIRFSDGFLEYKDGVMVRPERVGKHDKLRTLGMVLGFTPFAMKSKIDARQVEVRENPRLEFLLRQVILQRLDGGYASIGPAKYKLREMGMPDALVFDPSLPHIVDRYQMSTTTRPEIVQLFNDWLAKNRPKVEGIKSGYGIQEALRPR